ncbi:MAG TPA: CinA family nicotinamide mononucleotide deamidase-related protein [Polyangiaceae bacterium]|nr:CinA family nicotinamide mononucleotide deamidase-related protein [Polyangiaceae bacterium]
MTELARAAVLCIGTELTRGEIHNTNATWLAERLTALGLEVTLLESVADDPAAITRALDRVSHDTRLVAATGGLGPTTDDITSATVAAWLGVPQRRDTQVLAALEARLARAGRQLTASNSQQADFPEAAQILDNPHGTAPGFGVVRGACQLFFMPGVPREMRPMFESFIAPVAQSLLRGAQHQIRLRCFGVPESMLNDQLAGLEASHGVRVAYRAHFPEVEVKLLALADSAEAAAAKANLAASVARTRLGSAIYAEGEQDLVLTVGELLRARQRTLSLAESCTGGLVAALLTAHPASDFLLGGVVSYANAVKIEQLGVDPGVLEAHGAVSAEVARQMADGARQRFHSDLALSLTGIAGPSGATPHKPVGLVYYALSTPEGTLVRDVNVSNRPREGVQLYAAWCGLQLIREHLLAP